MYLGMESVMNRMSRLGKSVMFYDRIIPLEEVIDNIMAVTADDIQRFANQVLVPDKLCLAAIGGKEVLSVVEKGLSSVTRMGCHSSSNSWSETGCSQVRHRVQ